MRGLLGILVLSVLLSGCTSVGSLGIVTLSTVDTEGLLRSGKDFEELGRVEGKACRHFVLAVVPWGDSTLSEAVHDALAKKGGDAIMKVTVTSSLYGFIPIYNIYSLTCTTVAGVAVRFKS